MTWFATAVAFLSKAGNSDKRTGVYSWIPHLSGQNAKRDAEKAQAKEVANAQGRISGNVSSTSIIIGVVLLFMLLKK